jgi:hypothetical protein
MSIGLIALRICDVGFLGRRESPGSHVHGVRNAPTRTIPRPTGSPGRTVRWLAVHTPDDASPEDRVTTPNDEASKDDRQLEHASEGQVSRDQ